jgi:elongation of very long chain fatty acids protein 4
VSVLHVYHHTTIAWAWWIGLKLYPGGDIYFGALLNSWIHVMMYSYYTLSLLQIQCPWKKYLTMAQLAQFMSVVAYSIVSMAYIPKEGSWKHYLAYSVQVLEMVSLFVLFMAFYRKSYSKKKEERIMPKEVVQSSEESDTTYGTDPEQSSVSSHGSEF